MGLITLADGTQHNLTRDNSDELAKRQLAIFQSRGLAVDQAATYQAFLEASGRDTSFQTVAGTTIATKQAANVYADQVDANPLVSASNAVTGALPSSANTLLLGGSNFVFTAADKFKAAASAAAGEGKVLLGGLPEFLAKLNNTTRIALIVGGVVVLAAAGSYAIFKFKR